jgi:hypothetical protein
MQNSCFRSAFSELCSLSPACRSCALTGDEEHARRLELLEHDDALSSESSGEDDDDGARSDRLAQLGGLSLLSLVVRSERHLGVVRRVEAALRLVSALRRDVGDRLPEALLGELVGRSALRGAGRSVLADARHQLRIARHADATLATLRHDCCGGREGEGGDRIHLINDDRLGLGSEAGRGLASVSVTADQRRLSSVETGLSVGCGERRPRRRTRWKSKQAQPDGSVPYGHSKQKSTNAYLWWC